MQHRHLKIRLVKSNWLRRLLLCLGVVSVVAGVLGLFLPLVPSVPFLLVAVICFSRSSARFHSWLIEHRHLGPMLKEYLAHGAVPLRAKALAIGMIWVSLPVTAFWLVEMVWLRILLLSIAVCVSLYLLVIPTAPRRRKDSAPPSPAP